MSYFLEWVVAGVLVTTLGLVIMPWLALAVLMVVLFVMVAALAALVAIPFVLGRSLHRRWRTRRGARESQVLHRPPAAYTETRVTKTPVRSSP
jgi:membrane protein implicated in regulation of membrane protease activity